MEEQAISACLPKVFNGNGLASRYSNTLIIFGVTLRVQRSCNFKKGETLLCLC